MEHGKEVKSMTPFVGATNLCETHKEKKDIYCFSENEMFCKTCIINDHILHKKAEGSKLYQDYLGDMRKIESTFEKKAKAVGLLSKIYEDFEKDAKEAHEQSLNTIEEQFKRFEDKLRRRKNQLIEEVNASHKTAIQEIESRKQELEGFLEESQSYYSEVHSRLVSEEKRQATKEGIVSREELQEFEKFRNYVKEFEKKYIKKFVPFQIPQLVSAYSFTEESAALVDLFGSKVTVPLSSNRENERRLIETLKEQEKILFCPESIVAEKEIMCQQHKCSCTHFCPQMGKFICVACTAQDHKDHKEMRMDEGRAHFLEKLETEKKDLEAQKREVSKYNKILAEMTMEIEANRKIEEIEKSFAKQWQQQMELMRNGSNEMGKVNAQHFKIMQEYFEQFERKKMEIENFFLHISQEQARAKEAPFDNELLKELTTILEESQKMKSKVNSYLKEKLCSFCENQKKLREEYSKIQEDLIAQKIIAVSKTQSL